MRFNLAINSGGAVGSCYSPCAPWPLDNRCLRGCLGLYLRISWEMSARYFVGPELFHPTWRNGVFLVGKDNGRFLFGRHTLSLIIMVQWKMAGYLKGN